MTTPNPKSTSAAPTDAAAFTGATSSDGASTGAASSDGTSTDAAEAVRPAEEFTSSAKSGSGIRSRMSEAQRAMLASKSRGGSGQAQSVGKNHQPTQASGKKGPVEKKTRW